jgi:hypothetical protein
MAEKLARQWSLFLCLIFLSQFLIQWQKLYSGQIWPAPRVLVYPASGLLLGRPPLLSLFPHSSWNSSAEMGFIISNKSSNSPPPRELFLLPPPSGTMRYHSVDWWDECRVGQDGPPYSNKAQKSLTVSTPKTISPQAWGTMRPYAYYKFLKKNQGLLISCSSPNNKFKILLKVNFTK